MSGEWENGGVEERTKMRERNRKELVLAVEEEVRRKRSRVWK